jgi:hypothetical protein
MYLNSFGDDVRGLADFSVDLVLEAAARCLNVIASADGGPPPYQTIQPPTSVPARYQLGARLAEDCARHGYRGKDVGYQTFLHGDGLRSVFLFLVDKISSTSQEGDDDAVPWTPVATKCDSEETWDESVPSDFSEMDPALVNLLPRESRNAAYNLIQEAKQQKKRSIGKDEVATDRRESIRVPRSPEVTGEQRKDGSAEALHCVAGAKETCALQQLEYKLLRDDIIGMRREIRSLAVTSVETREREVERRDRLLQLLPSGQENLERLREIVQKCEQKLASMSEQWEEAKKDLDEEHNELLGKANSKSVSFTSGAMYTDHARRSCYLELPWGENVNSTRRTDWSCRGQVEGERCSPRQIRCHV